MVLPVLVYGHAALRQVCVDVEPGYPGLNDLIDDLWQTMYNAHGCGLAAPQVGHTVRLFVVDSKSTYDALDATQRNEYFVAGDTGIVETFINARIVAQSEQAWEDDEGCLSIPSLHRSVSRPWSVAVVYYDRAFVKNTRTFAGTTARMIQHEFDHTRGVLYLDYLSAFARRRLEGKLQKIARGSISGSYPMRCG